MKKILFILIFVCSSFLHYGQIIADHTIVDDYDKIPEYYLNEVKKMWLSTPGASHALGVLMGLNRLESEYSIYAVNRTTSGPPEAYTDQYLRATRSTWGDLDNPTGWLYGTYYTEDWFFDPAGEAVTKAGIAYCNDNGYLLDVFGFIWCYTGTNIDVSTYVTTTQAYVDYCRAQGYPTKVFFSTGPVDGIFSSDEAGWLMSQKWQQIRDSVNNDPSRILFDYADILCYDDGSEVPYTTTWNGNTYPVGTPTNTLPEEAGHIAAPGKLRLGKAMWWMLARMAGWDGESTGIEPNDNGVESAKLLVHDREIVIEMDESAGYTSVTLINLEGKCVKEAVVSGGSCHMRTDHLIRGVYFVRLNKAGSSETKKVIL